MTRIERLKIEFTDAKDSGRDELGPLHSHVAIEIQLALDLVTLVEKQHEAVVELGVHYCGTHDEDQPYHVVDPDDPAQVCECEKTVRIYREALAAFDQFNQEEG